MFKAKFSRNNKNFEALFPNAPPVTTGVQRSVAP